MMARAGMYIFLILSLVACATAGRPSEDVQAARLEVSQGMVAFESGDLVAAETHYRAAVQLDPNCVEGQIGLGAVLARSERDDDAVHCFQEAIRLDPENARAHSGLGVALSGQGDLEGAIRAFEAAVALSPGNSEARFGLGIAYLAVGDRAKALDQVRALEAIDPDMARTLRLELSPF